MRKFECKQLALAGAEQSIFVHNEAHNSLLCTIPFSTRPKAINSTDHPAVDEHLSRLFSEHRPDPDLLDLLDTFLATHIAKLAKKAQPAVEEPGKPEDTKTNGPQKTEDFKEGDRVRLRRGVRLSALAMGRLSKVTLVENVQAN